MTKLVSISDHNHAGLTSQSLRAAIGQLQDNRPLFQYVIGISGILPYQHVSRALKFFFFRPRSTQSSPMPTSPSVNNCQILYEILYATVPLTRSHILTIDISASHSP